ncbi:bacteriocin immunity protein [Yersinia kristensenii]|uniref:Bacteriocin immunity protein n=1 Tax=Yersinia kristensenii TaxID=28152 RepID=A0AB73NG23_YERKR|nr:bacteriocin immunity protein [Yersinia kristensenii]MDA5475121.1 bacteriocin immunity protein [Yersinia kristensenii]MDA5476367.1 bacteriocin immunity protein [Yersinia kristensenii]MDA5508095.1 bacteriocin immunity protein [Yersinia kristensenii]MDA5524119.1 bacteriocin immunity protein [Yersinia kristensenii]MDX6737728.1 bacteriocin immunity protein [Yersinia kristensenii]
MEIKKELTDYTENEFLELINLLFIGEFSSEEEHDELVNHIVKITEHPNGTDILYYPEAGVEDSPEGVIKFIKKWRAENGKPGFKE